MKLITVGTGSKGNCYLLKRDNDRYIALDCGMPWKKVMVATSFRPSDIDLALVTHIHSDHARYIGDFVANGIETVTTSNKARKILRKGEVDIVPFEVPHDVLCYGYLIRVDGRTIVYMTDFGYCRYTFKSWNVDTFVIACNHDENPDADEAKYAHVVMGHSSLSTVKGILEANKSESMKNVILVHYSQNADVEAMAEEIQKTVGDKVRVAIARNGEAIEI